MKVFFDVGAFDRSSFIQYTSGCEDFKVYMFEPHPTLASNLRNKFSSDQRFVIAEKAVCETDGETELYISQGPWWGTSEEEKIGGSCSIFKFKKNEDISKAFDHSTALVKNIPCPPRTDLFYSGKNIRVETTRMDTFINENKITKIDYLHIDAQGCDLEVLKSFGDHIKLVEEGICECAYDHQSAIYENQKYFLNDLVFWLSENGFDVLSVEANVPYSADGKNPNELNIRFKKRSN